MYTDIFLLDKNIIWTPLTKRGNPPVWTADTEYKLGDVVVPTVPQSGQENVMFQVVGFVGYSGSSTPGSLPVAAGQTVLDGEVEWKSRLASDDPTQLPYNEYYLINETVTVTGG